VVETTTRLWYELAAVLRLAEHTRRSTAADRRRYGAPHLPSLLFTHDYRYLLTSTAVPAPLREHTLRPLHVDGPTAPPHTPTRHYHLPISTSRPAPASHLGDLLRRAARAGQHWFTIEVGTLMVLPILDLASRRWRTVDAAPPDARWRPATVTAGDLGPYRAQAAAGYRSRNRAALTRFDRDTVRQLAADSTDLAPDSRAPLIVLDRDQSIMIAHGDRGGPPTVRARPDAGGWYEITEIGLPWTVIPDREVDDGGFETIGPNGEPRCTVCGSIEDPDHQSWPSMLGSGEEFSLTCTLCGSTESSHPFTGEPIVRRGTWPPTDQHQP